jgi:hypothetical protein
MIEPPLHRTLAAPGEGAMINGSWPKDKPRKYEYSWDKSDILSGMFENTWDKSDIWSGLMYDASCNMINEGLLEEGLIMIRSVHDRYNGIKRNPWNEMDGADHYSRPMHSWNILLSLSGFEYDGPAGKIGFAPRLTPDNFKCFFSAAEGWGNLSQKLTNGSQQEIIEVKWGRLRLSKLSFVPSGNLKVQTVKVNIDGKPIPIVHNMLNGKVFVSLASEKTLMAGQRMEILIK